MFELLLVPFLIIILFATIRFWKFSGRSCDKEKQWQEEHFNKQIEALKRASRNDNASE
jgi:hypothetical protein